MTANSQLPSEISEPEEQTRLPLGLGALAGLALAMRLWWFEAQPCGASAGGFARLRAAFSPLEAGLSEGLWPWIMAPIAQLPGADERWLFAVNSLWGALACAAVGLLALRLLGRAEAALGAAAVLAICPPLLRQSASESPLPLATLLAALALWQGMRSPRRGLVLTALAVMVSPQLLLLPLLLLVLPPLRRPSAESLAGAVAAIGLGLAVHRAELLPAFRGDVVLLALRTVGLLPLFAAVIGLVYLLASRRQELGLIVLSIAAGTLSWRFEELAPWRFDPLLLLGFALSAGAGVGLSGRIADFIRGPKVANAVIVAVWLLTFFVGGYRRHPSSTTQYAQQEEYALLRRAATRLPEQIVLVTQPPPPAPWDRQLPSVFPDFMLRSAGVRFEEVHAGEGPWRGDPALPRLYYRGLGAWSAADGESAVGNLRPPMAELERRHSLEGRQTLNLLQPLVPGTRYRLPQEKPEIGFYWLTRRGPREPGDFN